MDIHNSVVDIRDLKNEFMTAVMYTRYSITAVHNLKAWYP